MKLDVVLSNDLRKVWLNGRRMKRVGSAASSCRKVFGGQGVIVKLNDPRDFNQNKREVQVLEKWAGTKYAKHIPKLLDYSLHYTWIAVKRIYPMRFKVTWDEIDAARKIARAMRVADIDELYRAKAPGANWGMYKGEVMLLDLGYKNSW